MKQLKYLTASNRIVLNYFINLSKNINNLNLNFMKKSSIIIISLIILAGVIFTACPYSSTVPLAEPNVNLDKDLMGKWMVADSYSDNPNYFVFSNIDGKKFKAEKYEFNTTDEFYEVSGTYICHFTDIGSTRFANMNQDGTYYFYKIVIVDKNQFKLFEVTDNIDETFTSSTELYGFFNKYKDLSFFYNKDEEVYNRVIE